MMDSFPKIIGILNLTQDSFSDGGKYLDEGEAIGFAQQLLDDGAALVDVGPVASNPAAQQIPVDVQIRRIRPVLTEIPSSLVSLDSDNPAMQRFALQEGVSMLNDISGFSDPSMWAELAGSDCKLVVMHSVQGGQADLSDHDAQATVSNVKRFFEQRLHEMTSAGIAEDRLIIDPGMGFFLGTDPACSFNVLAALPELKRQFGLPLYICTSRKSFLKAWGASPLDRADATLSSELFATMQGVDYIRTHDVGQLARALSVWKSCSLTQP